MNNKTELVIILDESGSMQRLTQDVIGGFNALIEAQKKEEGETSVTTILFNDNAHFIHESAPIENVQPLNHKEYMPSGCTALLDAVGDAIAYVKAKHAKLTEAELPEHTVFSIMTDGMENASKEYKYQQIKDMIEMQKKCGWEFLFQAANIDVAAEADRLGIDPNKTMAFVANGRGVLKQMAWSNSCISEIRRKGNKRK